MRFSKWHALGNAYLLVERAELDRPLTPSLVERLCDDRTGIGSDGLLEVVEADGTSADVTVWNPDGTVAEFSGNGARIAAGWLAGRTGATDVRLRVGERAVAARVDGGDVELDAGRVEVGPPERLDVGGTELELTPVSVGNPHAVARLRDPEGEIERYGPAIERHERFPDGTNVQLVDVLGPHELAVAVWERGAGRTRSSGSSAVAAAAAAVVNGWCEPPVTVVLAAAGELRVDLDEDLRARLTGPVEEICRGELVADLP
jgi:diaminopimelate epimerase